MPVHRDREKKDTTAEDMELEEQEQEASSSEEEDSDTSSVSEDGDSSEMDEEDCERRRIECLDEMCNLEKQFTDLKDQLYRERLSQVNSKLTEVEAGRAAEYLEPLAVLDVYLIYANDCGVIIWMHTCVCDLIVFSNIMSMLSYVCVCRVRSCCCLIQYRVNWRRKSEDLRKTDTA
uniref:BRMS1 like transcriptional repressor b n=1 Tax=Sparus aurata TaxID=8175 RepID=A0A671XAY6_SPAAU